LQTISILAAFRFMVLMIFMAISLLKSLRNERRQLEFHEAIMRGRITQLLEEHGRAASRRCNTLWAQTMSRSLPISILILPCVR
jgi:choline-glycine betaine transporter